MYLVKKVDAARRQMGEKDYLEFWNACESATPLIAPNSQYNLEGSTETDDAIPHPYQSDHEKDENGERAIQPVFDTLTTLLHPLSDDDARGAAEGELLQKRRGEALSRKGYVLRAPCQDDLSDDTKKRNAYG